MFYSLGMKQKQTNEKPEKRMNSIKINYLCVFRIQREACAGAGPSVSESFMFPLFTETGCPFHKFSVIKYFSKM